MSARNARALADGMVPGFAPGAPAPDRARPHLHRPSGPGRARCPSASSSAPPARRTIPILVAGDEVIDGEQAILAYLDEHFTEPPDAGEQRAKAAKAKRKELEEACPKLTAATH